MGYALITGASSGIGSELARLFAADGHDLVLVGRREDLLDRLATELESDFRVKAVVMPLDISLLNAPKLIYERVSSKEGYLKYLVNNAGFYVHGPFTETDWEAEAQLIHIQCLNHTRLTKLFLPGMIKAGAGGILNVGSTGSFVPGPASWFH
ncbi:MAG: SDR family NAD(P)-dependent oxidoreductase [bacterium]